MRLKSQLPKVKESHSEQENKNPDETTLRIRTQKTQAEIEFLKEAAAYFARLAHVPWHLCGVSLLLAKYRHQQLLQLEKKRKTIVINAFIDSTIKAFIDSYCRDCTLRLSCMLSPLTLAKRLCINPVVSKFNTKHCHLSSLSSQYAKMTDLIFNWMVTPNLLLK